ncbi:MAG: glycosyltransferase family 2 protein [bacterium]
MSAEQAIEFSVVIVTFNNQNEIAACLNAFLRELQSRSSEIIVVDNHSSDKTGKCVRQVEAQHKGDTKIRLIENSENLGFTKALNQGLRISRGKYVVTSNPDVEVKRGALEQLKTALDAQTNVALVAPQLLNADGTVQPSCRRFPRYRDVLSEVVGLSYFFRRSAVFNGWKMGDFDHLSTRLVDQPQGAFLLFPGHLLQSIGFWDEHFPMFFSDVDWCRRIKNHGWEILFVPSAKVTHHRGRSVLRRRAQMIWSSHRSFYRYFKKYHTNLPATICNRIVGALLLVTAILRIAWTLFVGGGNEETQGRHP